MKHLFLCITVCLFVGCSEPEYQTEALVGVSLPPTRIVAWNIESDGSDEAVIAEQLAELDADIICLSEVPKSATEAGPLFEFLTSKGLGAAFGTTGNNDRLAICFREPFELQNTHELKEFDGVDLAKPGHRAPFVTLVNLGIGSFWLVNNHLARGNADYRTLQAETLQAWAAAQSDPVVFVGDYNMDFDFKTKSGNEAFRKFLSDGTIKWIEPEELIDTNWADRNGDGVDDYPHSMLDFTFVAGKAKEWKVTSTVIVRDGDFPDDAKTSDHRPVLTLVP